MPAIIINENLAAVVCYWDGPLGEYPANDGDIAISCPPNSNPNDATWLNILDDAEALAEAKLDHAKAMALRTVDAMVGDKRRAYITTSPGQEATYTAKLADAKAYIAANYPADASTYPWIYAEAQKTGMTSTAVADLIVSTANTWTQIGAAIEGARIAAHNAIAQAVTIEIVDDAVAQFVLEIEQID